MQLYLLFFDKEYVHAGVAQHGWAGPAGLATVLSMLSTGERVALNGAVVIKKLKGVFTRARSGYHPPGMAVRFKRIVCERGRDAELRDLSALQAAARLILRWDSELLEFDFGGAHLAASGSTATVCASPRDPSTAASAADEPSPRDASFEKKLIEQRMENDELRKELEAARVRIGTALDAADKAKRQLAYHNTHFQAEVGRLRARVDGQQAAAAAALKRELADQSKRLRRAQALEMRQLRELCDDERVSSALRITNLQAEVGELTRQLRRT